MVQHGRTKKRRSGRTGRIKLKNRSWNRWDPKPKIRDETVRKRWDPSKSPSVNLTDMGLRAQPNAIMDNGSTQKTGTKAETGPSIIELFDIPDSDTPKQKRHPLSLDDETYIAACMARWGDDYKRMFRDTKTNSLQHTEEKLQKMGARFILLTSEQRRVPVPDRVVHLLPIEQQEAMADQI